MNFTFCWPWQRISIRAITSSKTIVKAFLMVCEIDRDRLRFASSKFPDIATSSTIYKRTEGVQLFERSCDSEVDLNLRDRVREGDRRFPGTLAFRE